ncbi:hypothetical protein BGX24_010565 [Mortierella sp. AD032]|nr:hypothetical protein BGX24_010565 [Mortierella sp. AD032]
MQQQHALEIPEILALVGSFVPLWKHTSPNHSYSETPVFQPKTLVNCLQVSKLWHRTLLPIIWSLVDLRVFVGDKEEPTGAKRLLRANPGIKTLGWIGAEGEGCQYGPLSVLDVEDFEGLTGLESLYLHFWNCSGNNGRQLRKVLRLVGGSLKELRLERMSDVSPDDFLTSGLLSSSQQEVEDLTGESVLLALLETLRIGHCGDTDRCSAEVVQCCPKLKKLRYSSNPCDWSIDRLAISLEKHCPKFESLELAGVLKSRQIETLVRHCRRQLRTLHFSVAKKAGVDDSGQGQGQGDLVSAILEHSGKLEDVYVGQVGRGFDTPQLLQLLVGCIKLRRFVSTLSDNTSDDCALLEALKQQQWEGCQGTLEELEFKVSSRRGGRSVKSLEAIREDMRKMECEMRRIGYVSEAVGGGAIPGAKGIEEFSGA